MNLKSFPSAVIRTPLLPLNSNDALTPKEVIEEFLNNKILQEALHLATPSLYQELLSNFKDSNYDLYDDKQWKIILALTKYYSRMITRCTPFGLFSGCSAVKIAQETEITLFPASSLYAQIRLDMYYISELYNMVIKLDFFKKYVKYTLNTGVYGVGKNIRYFEYYYQKGNRFHRISSIEKELFFEGFLSLLKKGVYIQELYTFLLNEGYEYEEVISYVEDMIIQRFIITDMEPTITGEEPLSKLVNRLKYILSLPHIEMHDEHALRAVIYDIEQIKIVLDEISNTPIGLNHNNYLNLNEIISKINIKFSSNNLIQAVLSKNTYKNNLGGDIIEKVKKGINVIDKISNYRANQPNLKEFKRKFYERYEEQEISLLEVLDQDIGLGYPVSKTASRSSANALLRNVFILDKALEVDTASLTAGDFFWIKKIQDAVKNNYEKIILSDEDIDFLDKKEIKNGLSTVSVNVKVIDKIDSFGHDVLLSGTGFSSSAASVLSRFSNADEQIEKHLLSITNYEQEVHPNQIIAEIIHLPDTRVGNIIQRPLLREYEIPFLAQSSVEYDHIVQLEDLSVSIKNDRVILYSKKHKKEIIPKLTNAHNFFHKALPVYQFLCDLQFEQVNNANFGFEIPNVVKKICTRIPRIQYEDIIISPARWIFNISDGRFPVNKEDLKSWVLSNGIPPQVVLSEGDNDLFVNFKNDLIISVFLEEIRKKDSFELKEFLFNEKQSFIKDQDGNGYANELIVSFYDSDFRPFYTKITESKHSYANHRFVSGNEWIYFKIYTGYNISDTILLDIIKPFITSIKKKYNITQWFFIRYNDPEHHIRLRINCEGKNDQYNSVLGDIIKLTTTALNEKLIWKVQQDTYQRELDRYSEDAIVLVEKIFNIDSDYYTYFISSFSETDYIEYKWIWALLCMDNTLNMFFDSVKDIQIFCNKAANNFMNEFGNSKITKVSLDAKYRENKRQIEEAFNESNPLYIKMHLLLKDKIEESRSTVFELRSILAKNNDLDHYSKSVWSYIHMMVNRIFSSEPRANEMTCYFLLNKYYITIMARGAKNN